MSVQNILEPGRGLAGYLPEGRASFSTDECAGIAIGSRLQTRRGEILIEHLKVGEEILTSCGRFSKVRSRSVVLQPRSRQVALRGRAVRIRRDAFGSMQPCRDLVVSPGQIIFIDGRSELVAALINASTVIREDLCSGMVRIELAHPVAMMVECLAMRSA